MTRTIIYLLLYALFSLGWAPQGTAQQYNYNNRQQQDDEYQALIWQIQELERTIKLQWDHLQQLKNQLANLKLQSIGDSKQGQPLVTYSSNSPVNQINPAVNTTKHTAPSNHQQSMKQWSETISNKLEQKLIRWDASIQLFGNTFQAYVIDLNTTLHRLDFFWKDNNNNNYRTISRLKQSLHARGEKLLFATNGGMFNPNYDPHGLLITNGKLQIPLDTNREGEGNFYMQPNGVFFIDARRQAYIIPSYNFPRQHAGVINATQSGPMLVIDGIINSTFNQQSQNFRIRSGVGLIDNNRVVFLVSKKPVTFYDFANIFKSIFGCKNALFLDGSISEMYHEKLAPGRNNNHFGAIIGLTTYQY